MKKQELVTSAKRMMIEAYEETDKGGYDEWDQTFIELLRDKLLPHLSIHGLEMLIESIEQNSKHGIKR